MPGPDYSGEPPLPPSVHACIFRRHSKKVRNSGDFILPLYSVDDVEGFYKMDSINLRVVLADISRGRPSGSFTTLSNAAGNAHDLSDSSDDTDEQEDEEDGLDDDDEDMSDEDDLDVFELTPGEARAAAAHLGYLDSV
eukprot:gb/GEZN01014627.1/.p1 GENE.gb/GEZN01014627.1/~~gb/GEZN01014627.1/.p1  ORF type:complete len:138 (+),score=22.67 gb/GEZN01014627.1/:301-714(+)